MNRKEIYLSFFLLAIAFVVLLITLYPYRINQNAKNFPPTESTIPVVTPTRAPSPVVILSPDLTKPLHSPQKIIGLIDKSWVFEASFPLQLLDSQNKIIYQGVAAAPEWLEGQEKYTSFSTTLKFNTKDKSGFLNINADNPSGLPENDKNLTIPVIFSNK